MFFKQVANNYKDPVKRLLQETSAKLQESLKKYIGDPMSNYLVKTLERQMEQELRAIQKKLEMEQRNAEFWKRFEAREKRNKPLPEQKYSCCTF
jgi:uncharacterized protein involved in exopolysaccharide biosynthesis